MVSVRTARKIKPNRRSITGWAKGRDGNLIPFESALERDWIISLDFVPSIQSVHSQPFTIEYYSIDGYRRHYTPDFLATFSELDGAFRQIVYEVKYRDDLRENWAKYKTKFREAVRYCRREGLKFRIVTEREIRTPFVQNATFLRRYREYPIDEAIEIELIRTLRILRPDHRTPKILLMAAYEFELNRVRAIPHLWRLMDAHVIGFDSEEPLTMDSQLWIEEE